MSNAGCGATLKVFKEVGGMSRSSRVRTEGETKYAIRKFIFLYHTYFGVSIVKILTLSEYLVVSSRRGKLPDQEEERG